MYSKEEASRLRQQFWITFGKYMKPIPAAYGFPVNWINYKTGVKHIFFKMDANQHQASIAIEINHSDQEQRKLVFEKFISVKSIFDTLTVGKWDWNPNATNDFDLPLATICQTLNGYNIFNEQHWPEIISFLKPRIIALDEFWNEVKPLFEE